MNVTFLGTGTSQGVPVIACSCDVCTSVDYRDKRLRSSILVQWDNTHIVVDTGPDFRQQMLRERVKKLDAVLYTHAHKDHTAGLDDIRGFNFYQRKDMPLFATSKVIEQLKLEFAYIFSAVKYPGVPQVQLHPILNQPFTVEDKEVHPIEVMHYKLPVFGFRFNDFTYITDANYISPEEKEKLKGTKVLVVNALQKEDHLSHFTLKQALDLIEEVAPKKAYLTHLSHRMGKHATVQAELPDHVEIAWDGLQITID